MFTRLDSSRVRFVNPARGQLKREKDLSPFVPHFVVFNWGLDGLKSVARDPPQPRFNRTVPYPKRTCLPFSNVNKKQSAQTLNRTDLHS